MKIGMLSDLHQVSPFKFRRLGTTTTTTTTSSLSYTTSTTTVTYSTTTDVNVSRGSESNILGKSELNQYKFWIGRLRKKYENQQKKIEELTQNIKKVEFQIMELTNEEK